MAKQLSEMTPLQKLEGLAEERLVEDKGLGKRTEAIIDLFLLLQERLKNKGAIFRIDAAREIINALGVDQKHAYSFSNYIKNKVAWRSAEEKYGIYHTTLGRALSMAHGDYNEILNQSELYLNPKLVRIDTGILYDSELNLINFIKDHTSREERVVINCNF